MQMQMVARGLLAWELTGSFGAVGIISLSFGLPMLAFSLFGGVAADRFDKRNLVLATQAATGTLSLATAFLVATDVITIQILFALGLFQGTFVAFGMPARIPLMAAAVGPERMMSAVALNGAAMNATRLVGPALAGAIIAAFGIAAVYFAQSFIYLATLGLLLKVPAGLGQGMGGPQRQGVLPRHRRGARVRAREPSVAGAHGNGVHSDDAGHALRDAAAGLRHGGSWTHGVRSSVCC